MNAAVSWLYEVAGKPGQLGSFRTLTAELVDSTQAEPGALVYEWSFSDDESMAQVSERCADSAATQTHLARLRDARTRSQTWPGATSPNQPIWARIRRSQTGCLAASRSAPSGPSAPRPRARSPSCVWACGTTTGPIAEPDPAGA